MDEIYALLKNLHAGEILLRPLAARRITVSHRRDFDFWHQAVQIVLAVTRAHIADADNTQFHLCHRSIPHLSHIVIAALQAVKRAFAVAVILFDEHILRLAQRLQLFQNLREVQIALADDRLALVEAVHGHTR